jgi:hypothetical protein
MNYKSNDIGIQNQFIIMFMFIRSTKRKEKKKDRKIENRLEIVSRNSKRKHKVESAQTKRFTHSSPWRASACYVSPAIDLHRLSHKPWDTLFV